MLTSKQRATLRALANQLEPIIHVGKNGINDSLVQQLNDALVARELVKGTVHQNAETDATVVAQKIAKLTESEVVQVIGRRFVLYRANVDEPKIQL